MLTRRLENYTEESEMSVIILLTRRDKENEVSRLYSATLL